jgi:glyoxylase-like metal-dependent hydrolase (beta-lactamase superfamily II)
MRVFDCMIGDIRVTRVEEMVRPVARPQDWYKDYNEEELAPHLPWLAPTYYSNELGRLISSIHTWVLRTSKQTILIDTCTGNHKDRPGWPGFHMLETPYLDRLRAAGVAPEEVDVVLCTHLHVDHVGWNTRLENGQWVPTFPNAKYLMSRADHAYYATAAANPDTKALTRNTYNDSVLPVVEAALAVFVEGNEEIDTGLTMTPAAGHTPGQVRLNLDSAGRLACFCGDVLHHPLQVPLWHWRTNVCVDPDKARDTRRDVLAHCAESGALLLPAHFADPHGGYVTERAGRFELHWPHTPGARRQDSTASG